MICGGGAADTSGDGASPLPFLRGFAVRGVFWRQYLDWAIEHVPFYFQPVLLFLMTIFFFFFAGPARRSILSNLAVIFPGSSRVMNLLRAFRTLHNFAWTITEAATYKLKRSAFAYEVIGAENLDQLTARQGAIVLTAHMGNYDLGAALFAQKCGREIRMVRAPEPDQQTGRHLSASLQKIGEGAVKIDYNTEGTRLSFDLLNALRQGEIVSIQGDRAMGSGTEARASLFGREVLLPSGPFILAQVAQAPIFPLFIVRAAYRRYAIIVSAPIMVPRSGRTREEDIAPAIETWCDVLEGVIAQHWDQWFSLIPIFFHASR